jgi:hypothetical protein
MPRGKITREELERQFVTRDSTLHPEFPNVHSRIPKTVSKFVTATIEEADARTDRPQLDIDPAKRDKLRSVLRSYMRHR